MHLFNVYLMALPFILQTSCATAFLRPDAHIVFKSPKNTLDGASFWLDGVPTRVESLLIEEKSKVGFGKFKLTQNVNPYEAGPGHVILPIRKAFWSSDAHSITIRKPGYRDKVIAIDRKVHPVFYANILNLFGFMVDLYSGFLWSFEPRQHEIDLERAR